MEERTPCSYTRPLLSSYRGDEVNNVDEMIVREGEMRWKTGMPLDFWSTCHSRNIAKLQDGSGKLWVKESGWCIDVRQQVRAEEEGKQSYFKHDCSRQ
jgi:hypothetical protein